MVIDQDNLECYNTEVSNFVVIKLFLSDGDNCIHAATGKDGSLEKILFARIIDKNLVYENGESDSTVYPGLYS